MLIGMINVRRVRVGWVIVMSAGALLVAGCGSDDKASNGWDSAAPSTAPDQLLLSPNEFPADTTKLDVPPDKLQAAVADISGINDNATFTPADCGSAQQDLGAAIKELLDQSAIAGATSSKSGTIFVEFIANRTGDLARISDTNKRCPDVSMTSTVDNEPVTSRVQVENVDAPSELNGANAVVFRSTSTATVGTGAPLTTTGLTGFVEVRGKTVSVRVAALSESVDEAAFQQFFVAAAQKARDAS